MHTHFLAAKKQKGMTMIGIVLMFLFVGFLLLAVLRVWPLYYENLAVQRVLDNFSVEFKDVQPLTSKKMKEALQIKLDVQDVTSIKAQDIKITKTRKGFKLDASYDAVANYMGNFNFMVEFDHVLELEK